MSSLSATPTPPNRKAPPVFLLQERGAPESGSSSRGRHRLASSEGSAREARTGRPNLRATSVQSSSDSATPSSVGIHRGVRLERDGGHRAAAGERSGPGRATLSSEEDRLRRTSRGGSSSIVGNVGVHVPARQSFSRPTKVRGSGPLTGDAPASGAEASRGGGVGIGASGGSRGCRPTVAGGPGGARPQIRPRTGAQNALRSSIHGDSRHARKRSSDEDRAAADSQRNRPIQPRITSHHSAASEYGVATAVACTVRAPPAVNG